MASFANGNVNVETNGRDNGRTATYTYDALNRVSTAKSQATSGSNCWGQSFAYDRYANLTTTNATQCSAPILSLSVNTDNEITNSGFKYDAAGDLTGDGVNTYTWNAEAHLKTAAGVTYTYDGDLRRVKKSNGTLYWYCAACGQVLAETDLSGNLTSEYTFFNRRRIARRDVSSGNVYYIFSDRLRSYRTLTDSSGNVKGESDYYPFGAERVISSTVTDNFRFAGMEWDSEDGQNHTRYRQYTSAQGRWQTPDRKRGCVMFPQGQNLYAYVKDDPTNLIDLLGDDPISGENPCGGTGWESNAECQGPWGTGGEGGGGGAGGAEGGGGEGGDSFSSPFVLERICYCSRINLKPILRRCSSWCNCTDGSCGIGLFTVNQLRPVCGPSVQFFCPAQVQTWSAVYYWPPEIFVVVAPIITGCTLF